MLVAGVRDGEIQLELTFNEHRVALYRALVRPIVRIPYRVVLLRCPGPATFVSESMIASDILRANIILRQVAVELVPDTAPPAEPRTRATGAPGIHVAQVSPADTLEVSAEAAERLSMFDARPNIVNLVIVGSRQRPPSPQVAGEWRYNWHALSCRYPESTLSGESITDRGVPGTSWLGSTGIPPSTSPHEATMQILGGRLASRGDSPGPLVCIIVSGGAEYQGASAATRAVVLAHEIGHTLNLKHRAAEPGEGADGLPEPARANVMNPGARTDQIDLDIIQARAIRASHLVTHYLANPLPSS